MSERRPWKYEKLRKALLLFLSLAVLAAAAAGGWLFWRSRQPRAASVIPAQPSAPPALAPHATRFRLAVQAIEQGDPARGVQSLSSFSFGSRPVEEYRLYYLALALEQIGNRESAREALATLWRSEPELVHAPAVGAKLATLYTEAGGNARAGEVWGTLASRTDDPNAAAQARMRYLESRFRSGDVGAMILAATNVVVENPIADEAGAAAAMLRAIRGIPPDQPLPLTVEQRIRRGEALLQAARPKAAFEETDSINADALRDPLRARLLLVRGEALSRVSRHEASNQVLEPLFSSAYRFAIPALRISATNHRLLAKAADEALYKTVTERVRSGTRTVTRKGKKVRVAAYKNVKKRVRLKDPKREEALRRHEALYVERLNDLRSLPIESGLRAEVLSELVDHYTAKENEREIRRYVTELVEVDPTQDPALQHFWDRGWEAWEKRNYDAARDLFNFIAATYRSPNIQRQATYWFARCLHRTGEEEEARRIYRQLALAPYQDVYALYSQIQLGADAPAPPQAPPPRVSWEELAEAEMPDELRLAWELSAVGLTRDARFEIQKKVTPENRKWADSILGDTYYVEGNQELAYRYLRRAWPELATPEQNSVPWRFLEMYYPLRFEEEIREAAEENDLDPYLLMALIRQESAFNPNAKSWAGATGLMQIMPATGQELGTRAYGTFSTSRLTDPEVNIELGSRYLKRVLNLLDGNVELALAGYNGGPYRVRKWRAENPKKPLDEFLEGMPFGETRGYVKRITLLRSSYRQLYGSPAPHHPAPAPAS